MSGPGFMPSVLYREEDGRVPVVEWLDIIPSRARAKCFARIERVEQQVPVRRPETVSLGDGLHSLCARHGGTVFFVLFCRDGEDTLVLLGGVMGKGRRPDAAAVQEAAERKRRFEAAPMLHTYTPGEARE